MNRGFQSGFTLIEVIIVVAIVAIIAAVAFPSYQDSIRKSCRNDGKNAILEIVSLQEKNYFQNNQYSSLEDLGYANISPEGCYALSLAFTSDINDVGDDGEASCGGDSPNCFIVLAEARGDQLNDSQCERIAVNSLGQKFARNSDDDDTTASCW